MLKKIFFAIGCVFLVAACDPLDQYRNKSADSLYETALDLLSYGRYERAAKVFEEVDLQHPSSPLAAKSLLLSGYCYYLDSDPTSRNTNRFAQAVDKFESFMRLHPNHKNTDYAMYMIGVCYFEMLGDGMRDQSSGAKALNMFESLTKRFPKSVYTQEAQLKIDIINRYAALKNLYVSEVLIQQRQFAAAINRLNGTIKSLSKADRLRAQNMLNECYKALKLNHLMTK